MTAPLFPGRVNRWVVAVSHDAAGPDEDDIRRVAKAFVLRQREAAPSDVQVGEVSREVPRAGLVVAIRTSQDPMPTLRSAPFSFAVVDFVPRTTNTQAPWPSERFGLIPTDATTNADALLEDVREPLAGEAPPRSTPGERVLDDLGDRVTEVVTGPAAEGVRTGALVLTTGIGLWLLFKFLGEKR